MTTKAIIYARWSPRPGEADDIKSNDVQIARCREYAAQNNLEVVDVFEDQALSGMDEEADPDPMKALAKRPGICAALDSLKHDYVLLCRWRSRFAREEYVQTFVERTAWKKGARVIATDENNEVGMGAELQRSVEAIVAKYKVLEIRFNTARMMKKHQVNGRRMTRVDRIPFGWRLDPSDSDKIIEDEAEQSTARLIRGLAADGLSMGAICRQLDSIGLLRRGKSWRNGLKVIQRILRT